MNIGIEGQHPCVPESSHRSTRFEWNSEIIAHQRTVEEEAKAARLARREQQEALRLALQSQMSEKRSKAMATREASRSDGLALIAQDTQGKQAQIQSELEAREAMRMKAKACLDESLAICSRQSPRAFLATPRQGGGGDGLSNGLSLSGVVPPPARVVFPPSGNDSSRLTTPWGSTLGSNQVSPRCRPAVASTNFLSTSDSLLQGPRSVLSTPSSTTTTSVSVVMRSAVGVKSMQDTNAATEDEALRRFDERRKAANLRQQGVAQRIAHRAMTVAPSPPPEKVLPSPTNNLGIHDLYGTMECAPAVDRRVLMAKMRNGLDEQVQSKSSTGGQKIEEAQRARREADRQAEVYKQLRQESEKAKRDTQVAYAEVLQYQCTHRMEDGKGLLPDVIVKPQRNKPFGATSPRASS